MKPQARWLPLAFVAALLPLLGQAPPATAPKETHFPRGQSEVRSLNFVAPGGAFIAGPSAIYEQTTDIFHWRAIDSLVSNDFRTLAGGDKDHVFFTTPDGTTRDTYRLMEWTRASGQISDLGTVYDRGGCQFINATRGAALAPPPPRSMESPGLLITADGGKTWTLQSNLLGPKAEVRQFLWVSPDQLLIGGDGLAVCCNVDEKGHLTRDWTISRASPIFFPGPAGTVWIAEVQSATKVDLANGKTLARVKTDIQFEAIAEVGPDLWFAGEENAAIFHADADGGWKLVKKFDYPWPPSAFSGVGDKLTPEPPGGWVQWITTGTDGHALLIGIDGQTYTWDGKSDALATQPLMVDNTPVIAAAKALADGQPTAEQFQEFRSLIAKIGSGDRLGDLFVAAKEKQTAENLTDRQHLAWLIGEMKKLADSDAKIGPPPPRTATGIFESSLLAVQFFSPTSGIAITGQGVSVTNGDRDHWKGQMGWDHPVDLVALVGITENQFYAVVLEEQDVAGSPAAAGSFLRRVIKNGKEVEVRDQYCLVHWTKQPDGGKLVEIRKLPRGFPTEYDTPPACAFVDERTGAFVDGQKLMVTRDAGVTWVETTLQREPTGVSGVQQIAFCNDNQVVITAGLDAIALLSLDKDGHAHQEWHQGTAGKIGYLKNDRIIWPQASAIALDVAHKLAWVASDRHLEAFNLADGKVAGEFNPFAADDEYLTSYYIAEGQMFTFGDDPKVGRVVRVWDLQNFPPKRTAQIAVAQNGMHLNGAFPTPDKGPLYLLLNDRQLIEWNGKPEIPVPFTSDTRRPTIDNTLLSAAEDQWPPGDSPSRKESAALSEAARGLSPAQRVQLSAEAQQKAKDFANDRARTLWMTQRATELKQKANP